MTTPFHFDSCDVKTPLLIGIGGKLASGKDTVADYLVSDYSFVKMGMSEPLNTACLALNPWLLVSLDERRRVLRETGTPLAPWVKYAELHERLGYTAAKEIKEFRETLQKLGTEVGRDMIDTNVWSDVAKRNIQDHMAEGRSVILTGIRFVNERQMISSLGGSLIWVDRPSLANVLVTGQHASENTLGEDDFQVTISNDGTLKDLETKSGLLVETLRTLKGGAYNQSSGEFHPPYDR